MQTAAGQEKGRQQGGSIEGSATTGLLCNTFGVLNRGPSCRDEL